MNDNVRLTSTMKKCPKCNLVKDPSEFYTHKNRPLSGYCKSCSREYEKIHKNKFYGQTSHTNRQVYCLKKLYGMTPDEFNKIYDQQNGRCALCKRVNNKRLQVDHDHKTKRIRGLLCYRCNAGLGWIETVGIDNVLEYLVKNNIM